MDAVAELMQIVGQGRLSFEPRPHQPDRFDESNFYHSKLPGVAFLVGGNGDGTCEVAAAKVAKFVLEDQAPPRTDTPFWLVGLSYELTMETLWKEKLSGHGHIGGGTSIGWYDSKRGLPAIVPLKPEGPAGAELESEVQILRAGQNLPSGPRDRRFHVHGAVRLADPHGSASRLPRVRLPGVEVL